MASSSSRRGKKAAHLLRNASANGCISDDEEQYKFGCYRKLFKVVPHKFLDVELFRREGFIFQEWLVDVGLLKFVEMTGDCYPDLVQVFYHNLKVVDGVICSRVKGVNIKIDDEIWLSFTGLKAEGFMPHERNSELNQWTNKKKIYKEYLRSPTRLKHHQVDLTGEKKIWCTESNEIGKAALRHNGLKKTKDGWVFKDVDETPSTFTPQTKCERFVMDQFRRLSTRISKVEKSLIMIHKKSDEDNALITPSASESDDEDDTTKDESMETSDSD
ncbi:hypothetical protein LR48_Vigan03g102000 [Vigna angularis]|uniref:Uncharacterized protein n=1 Tax=Phaseolus angularis TaxID=3914 RepID=A0A0L9U483_PHAAN|nr:hypothetical protein LR48_Vigan03g102000 [Vigna angularis]